MQILFFVCGTNVVKNSRLKSSVTAKIGIKIGKSVKYLLLGFVTNE